MTEQVDHRRSAKDGDITRFVNCVTAVRHVIEKASGSLLPHGWIGNLPRALVFSERAKIFSVRLEEIQAGDLLFLKNRAKEETVSHLAVALSVDKIFHSSHVHGRPWIESLDQVYLHYTQAEKIERILTYIDPRTLPDYKRKEEEMISKCLAISL